jgi:uncharacterized protein YjdB
MMRLLPHRLHIRLGLPALLALLLGACDGGVFHPGAEPEPAALSLGLPSLDLLAAASEEGIADAFRKVDGVRVVVQASSAQTPLLDRTLPVGSPGEEIRLRVEVPLDDLAVGISVTVQMFRGTDLLFQGADDLTLERGRLAQAEVSVEPVPAGVVLGPPPAPLAALGDETQLSAAVVFATGDVIPGLRATWQSLAPEVVSVTEDGLARAESEGVATLQASHEGFSASLEVEVRLVAVALEAEPASLEILEGDAATILLTALDSRGNSFTPNRVTWTSSSNTVATVDGQGTVTGVLPGTAVITATQDGIQVQIPVTVLPRAALILIDPSEASLGVGLRLTLAVTVRDARGAQIVPPGVEWSSSDPSIATVDASGEVTGVTLGEVEIRASRDGVTGVALLRIVQTAGTIRISPREIPDLRVQESQTLSVEVRDVIGNPIEPPEVTWSSEDPAVATVNAAGVVTGVAPGLALILAARDGVADTARVTVIERVPRVLDSRLVVSPGAEGEVLLQVEALVESFGVDGLMWFQMTRPDGTAEAIGSWSYAGSSLPVADSSRVVSSSFDELEPGIHSFQAFAVNEYGSDAGEVLTYAYLPPVSSFWFSPGGESVDLEWYYGSGPISGVSFQIQRRIAGAPSWTQVATVPALTSDEGEGAGYYFYRDEDASDEESLEYRIRVCQTGTTTCSGWTLGEVD